MSDRQELIDWLRYWKHEVPTTREREEMIEAMRDAATALEEAQGVPREPTDAMLAAVAAWSVSPAHPHLGLSRNLAGAIWQAMYDAAPAAPTREPRDEQDAKRLYHELLYAVATKHPGESRHETALRYIREREDTARHDAGAKAALAEPKR